MTASILGISKNMIILLKIYDIAMKLIAFILLLSSSVAWSSQISFEITDYSGLCEIDSRIKGHVEITAKNNSNSALKLIYSERNDNHWLRIYFNLIAMDGDLWSTSQISALSVNVHEALINPKESRKFLSNVYISNNTSPEVLKAFEASGKLQGANGGQLLGKYTRGDLVIPTNQVIIKNIKKCSSEQE